MPQIVVLPHADYCPEGAVLEASPGATICEALLENDIELELSHKLDKICGDLFEVKLQKQSYNQTKVIVKAHKADEGQKQNIERLNNYLQQVIDEGKFQD